MYSALKTIIKHVDELQYRDVIEDEIREAKQALAKAQDKEDV